MFTRKWTEMLRILDVQCAQRARWLGISHEKASDQAAAEEALRHAREETLRMLREKNGFAQR